MKILTLSLKKGICWLTLGGALLTAACQRPARSDAAVATATAGSAAAAPAQPAYANPVLPGDFADPSVTKVGDTYWASATTSEWGPSFPLLKSKDLTKWELVGHVFPDQLPAWADANFWAPEISEDGGKTYIFYTAHKKGGSLCVGVASADNPAGPYRDHGPLVCQDAGSIDGFPIRDEKGQLYLVWKEDGNSRNLPTPIWVQRLNDDRTALVGEPKELIRNDVPWEGNLVEGPSIVRHDGYFYMFYAGNGCCGRGCTYATGVARARNLLGPWEKYSKNPILQKNEAWQCPGHGTAVAYNNRWYFLYHGYSTKSTVYPGRQGLLDEFTWNAEGWPEFRGNSPHAAPVASVDHDDFTDEFRGSRLAATWQWPVSSKPVFSLDNDRLQLTAQPDRLGAVLGQRTYTTDYTASTILEAAVLPAGTLAGIATLGDPSNAIVLTAGQGKVRLWQVQDGKRQTLAETALPATRSLTLRLHASGGDQYRFSWSTDGKTWQNLPADGTPVNGAYLPPWDRGVRTGILAQGPGSARVSFDNFVLDNQ